jgi:PIN domain nuclease of toxin-antitoxin system
MIVLDTHALVWWAQQPELLSEAAAEAIGNADRICVPTITLWEVALLVRKGRLALRGGRTTAVWVRELLSIPRLGAVPLSAEIAIDADSLEMHADPADRLIAATARALRAPLVTKDSLLRALGWLSTVW